jgi:hypothetical protein
MQEALSRSSRTELERQKFSFRHQACVPLTFQITSPMMEIFRSVRSDCQAGLRLITKKFTPDVLDSGFVRGDGPEQGILQHEDEY